MLFLVLIILDDCDFFLRNFFSISRRSYRAQVLSINCIISFQVPPAELEGILRTHPSIIDAAVVGIPHPKTGEAPLAFVVVDPDEKTPSVEDVLNFVSKRVSPYKQITGGVQFVDSLPKSAAGKILRRLLKDEYMKNQA